MSSTTWKLCFEMLFPLAHEVHETNGLVRVPPQHYSLELVCTSLPLQNNFVSQALVSYYRCWQDIQGGSEILVEAVRVVRAHHSWS